MVCLAASVHGELPNAYCLTDSMAAMQEPGTCSSIKGKRLANAGSAACIAKKARRALVFTLARGNNRPLSFLTFYIPTCSLPHLDTFEAPPNSTMGKKDVKVAKVAKAEKKVKAPKVCASLAVSSRVLFAAAGCAAAATRAAGSSK